jgi:hypothetical protein
VVNGYSSNVIVVFSAATATADKLKEWLVSSSGVVTNKEE